MQEVALNPHYEMIKRASEKFTKDCSLSYDREKSFAMQIIKKSKHVEDVARNNPMSLLAAMSNVANIGLSLNPATNFAYLVPRDNAICLDISYTGLVKLATDSGVIEWVQAEMVYSADNFIFNGVGEKPTHNSDPFAEDRGEVKGVYCVAKTAHGDHLTCTMSLKEILEVKNTSKAAGNYSPWNTFFNEMAKKSVVKRASKLWPKSRGLEKLSTAIKVINEHEGLKDELPTDEQYDKISDYCGDFGKKENEVAKIAGKNKLEDVTQQDAVKIIAYIKQVYTLGEYVNGIKNSIKSDDELGLIQLISELSDSSYSIITKAPTKGGPLTVAERNHLMSDEFRRRYIELVNARADEALDGQQLAANQ